MCVFCLPQHEAAERYAQMQQDLKSLMDALNIAEKRVSDEKGEWKFNRLWIVILRNEFSLAG